MQKILLALALLSIGGVAISPEIQRQAVTVATRVLPIDTLNDALTQIVILSFGYVFEFLAFGAILELINPTPKNKYRMKMMKRQIYLGIQSLVLIMIYTVIWMWIFDPLTPYYGYWETHQFTFKDLLINLAVYMFTFDTWFYWTHRILHHPKLMRSIHALHHSFSEPTAYCQDAVHWLEALIQGPMGHFLPTFFWPMHPLATSIFGFFTSNYALLAHDGRALDLNDHIKHHHYHHCNFGLYWGFWDYLCDTRYSKSKYPKEYIPSWQREEQEAAKKVQ